MHATLASAPETTFDALLSLVKGRKIAVLTGAGCSTESGIPDYRGPGTRARARKPIQGPELRRSAEVQRRYWARAVIGWERFRQATPNPAHLALARLEREGHLTGLITQNVDRLHHQAGSRRVVELHGALAEAHCVDCGVIEARESLQARLLAENPGWLEEVAPMAPDGDADLPEARLATFKAAPCLHCGGPMRPRVVMFGESVPRPVVDEAFSIVDEADVLLVVGSSLAVFSGYRFVLRAAQRHMPVAIVSLGPVRGEELARVKLDETVGLVLPRLAHALVG